MAMDIVESIVSKIMPYAAGSAWSHIGYIIFYKNNVEKLDTQLQSLVAANDSLQQRVNAAIRNGEEIFINVKNSLEKANVSIGDANNFLVDEDHARVGCLNWPLTSLCRMHQLGKKSSDMVNTISEIKTQLNEALKMDTISSLPRLNVSLCPSTRGYEALQSRTLILNQIMQELKDDSLYMIGVHGMGGVGKTTLVEEVAWQAELDDCYGVVIKAIVSNSANVKGIQGQEEDVRQIQDQLADCLGLKFSEPSLQGRARRLRDKIIKEDKVLVIMDDLWRKIDLKEVGVPFGDQHKGCKLLLTSRDLNVLSKEMGTQQNFRLVTLSKEEGWNLFEKEVGNVVKQYHIQTIASEVAEACKGLPLLLVAVAKALKNEEHLYAWIDAFKQLTTHDDDGLSSITNKALDLSYKYLASDRHKSIFLLIGSFGQRFCHIEDLLMWVWGLGLFRKVDTLEDARNKLHKIIDDLKASSLILDKEGNYVTMHDVIREGAAKIASRDQPFFFLEEGTELKEMDELRNCKRIILSWCYISSLPECFDCPKLELLILCGKNKYLKISDDFFSRMRDLKYLNLGRMMCSPSLPPSLSLLKKLKVFYLKRCMLENITLISELTGLEILSLEYTDIEELPKEIGKLIHLRKLNLDNCTKLRLIPANLISSLTRLEELHMGNCFCIQWEVEGSKQCSNASLGELRHLDHLKSLHLQIGDISNMPRDLLIFGKLQRYKILVGHGWRQSWYSETSRTLKLKLSSTTTTSLDDGIKMLLGGVEDLSLAEVKGVRNVLPELTGEGFPLLKHLLVKNCVEILYIIDSTKCLLPPHSFLCLETLIIHDLINLEKICCGQFPKHIFTKLQKIEVVGCEQLKNIFSFSMARNLTKLFRIEISDCEFMRNVIVEQEEECEDNEQINFSKLLSITLMKLPNLVTFSSKKSNITKDSDNLSHPIALFDEKIAMPNLETLKVKSCHNFKYLFSSSLVKTLVKLEKLDIRDCCMMEHIFVQDEDEYLCKEKYEMQPILHNIETVKISECPMLMNIFPSSVLFQNLVDLWIHGCSGIVNIMTSSTARSLVNLSYLWISDCEMLEEIVECENDSDGIGEIAFMKLKKLILSNLPRLTRFCKENFIFKLPLLERLLVEKCPELEAFSPIIFYSAPKLTQVKSQMKFENWW
ncbi:putative winged helix-turn-helix DNA-binding domain, leucine-rich repeat domain, L [Lupinus albus]|uniref:Putative winged helix-turn-helix DNA-binding domain, leucine-rich repeat domain, L n=1 Tax=Lupinus albus TaxID=3870 RepID=A0A6A4R307_LUPAL|nr:putative winged helix-turn-helix DNA-binding domain, leucine-rich repeat domain, L [Lupinus albus]